MTCFQYLTKVLWCPPQGTFVNPRECLTCDVSTCRYSRNGRRPA